MEKCVISACFLLLACLGERCGADDTGIFDVNQFGAIPDGITDNSEAFSAAWKAACGWNGEISTLVIPEGTYLTSPVLFVGPCRNVTKMIVQMSGMVMASTDMNKFPKDDWLVFRGINGLLVTGGGVFNGQGSSAWGLNHCRKSNECKLLPASLKFLVISNSMVRNISSVDSKMFHIVVYRSQNLDFQDVKISAPADSPNTDGISIHSSTNVTISSSQIGTGDDCIAIGHGNSNISISNVFCGPGHGISVGSLGKYPYETDVSTIRVTNCTLVETDNGIRIKTWANSKSNISVSDVIAQNITIQDVKNPIIIDQRYCPQKTCSNQIPSSVKIRDVHFEDIRGTSTRQIAVNLLCSESYPCQNITLHNIDLKYNGGAPSIASCLSVNGSSTGIQIPPPCICSLWM